MKNVLESIAWLVGSVKVSTEAIVLICRGQGDSLRIWRDDCGPLLLSHNGVDVYRTINKGMLSVNWYTTNPEAFFGDFDIRELASWVPATAESWEEARDAAIIAAIDSGELRTNRQEPPLRPWRDYFDPVAFGPEHPYFRANIWIDRLFAGFYERGWKGPLRYEVLMDFVRPVRIRGVEQSSFGFKASRVAPLLAAARKYQNDLDRLAAWPVYPWAPWWNPPRQKEMSQIHPTYGYRPQLGWTDLETLCDWEQRVYFPSQREARQNQHAS